MPLIDDDKLQYLDQHYRDRIGTLLSIDDLVANVVHGLAEMGVLENTYILVSADHGYHIGNYKLPMEKMWHWETDVRIPFYIRGPGIEQGQVLDAMGVNIDIAPTLLDAAGLLSPSLYDGKSLLPLVSGNARARDDALASWRTRTVISFAEGYDQFWGKVTLSSIGNAHGAVTTPPSKVISPPFASHQNIPYTFDNPQNQWRALRIANATHNVTFVQYDPTFHFRSNIAFEALYDLNADPYMMRNVWKSIDSKQQASYQSELESLFACRGPSCI